MLSRWITDFVGGYFVGTADCHGRDLLLPLCGVTGPSELREDVRIAEVCFAAMGYNLREAAPQAACRESRRGSALCASRPE
jgi:hypothetical protein